MKLEGEARENADRLLNAVGTMTLNDLMSHSQILLEDIQTGAIHANNISEFSDNCPDCTRFLIGIIMENIKYNIEAMEEQTDGD